MCIPTENKERSGKDAALVFPYITITRSFIALFTLGMIAMTVWSIYEAARSVQSGALTVHEAYSRAALLFGANATVVAGVVALLKQIWRVIMVFAEWLQEALDARKQKREAKILDEGVQIGKAEGKIEGLQEAHGWYRRFRRAQERGEPFDEPFPGIDINDDAAADDDIDADTNTDNR